jgi:hypothetical protein
MMTYIYRVTKLFYFFSALLFTVRSLSLRKHAGEVSFPGGIHDDSMDGDQLERTAVRETVEELPSLTAEVCSYIMYIMHQNLGLLMRSV